MRRLHQRLFLYLLWGGFFALWWRVLSTATWSDVTRAWLYVGLFGSAYGLLLIGWIRHNQRIWRRKGPRTHARMVVEDWSKDHLGRPVNAADPAVWSASFIRVDLRDGVKSYQAVPLEAAGQESTREVAIVC